MSPELFKRIVSEMHDAGVKEIGLFYIGESFLNKWLPEAIQYCKDIGIEYTFLTTNGSKATPDRVEACMKAGLDSLKWSFNSYNPAQYRSMTDMAISNFNDIIKNIQTAYKIREENDYPTKLYASSIQYDGEQRQLMTAAIKDIIPYVDEHYWLPLLSFGDQAKVDDKLPVVGNPGRADNMRNPLPCWAVFKEGHVTYDGKLSACCFDNSDSWIMSDLNEMSFMDAWNSEDYQNLRRKHLDGDVHGTACETCIHGDPHTKVVGEL
jgi:MoaA/NifB/PqqE/SkfB family radical SAM enzyme